MKKFKITRSYSMVEEIVVESETLKEAQAKARASDDWEEIDYDEHDFDVEELD